METFKKFAKMSQKAEITCKKNFGEGRDLNPRSQKSLINL